MGQEEKSTGNELRQTQPEYKAVLQEGNHEKNGTKPEVSLSVLSSVLSVKRCYVRCVGGGGFRDLFLQWIVESIHVEADIYSFFFLHHFMIRNFDRNVCTTRTKTTRLTSYIPIYRTNDPSYSLYTVRSGPLSTPMWASIYT